MQSSKAPRHDQACSAAVADNAKATNNPFVDGQHVYVCVHEPVNCTSQLIKPAYLRHRTASHFMINMFGSICPLQVDIAAQ